MRTRALTAVAALALVAVGCGTDPGAHRTALPPPHHSRPPAGPKTVVAPPGTTLVAATRGTIPGSPAPGAPQNLAVPASWYGYPSVLPVIGAVPNWVEVRLAQRPNGSTTWVPQSDVVLSPTPYRMVVNLATERLTVYLLNKLVMTFPAGIGAPDDPTVPGQYFVTMKVPAPSPGYGPFVLVTSDHSDTITDWEDSGDAIIAIHGPITAFDDQLIGTTGAAISHGCIRLHDSDLAQLNVIPNGTPLDIISGAPST